MRSLERRLNTVDDLIRKRHGDGLQGVLETHYTRAWSEGNADSAPPSLEPCSEHGPTCGVSINRTHGRIHRVLVLAGPYIELG